MAKLSSSRIYGSLIVDNNINLNGTINGYTLGNVSTVNTNSSTSNFLRGDGTWATPPNTIPNNGTLTMSTSGTGLSGSATFTANQSGPSAFTVTSNATSANTASTIVARDASGNFSAGTITASLTGNAATATKLHTARTINGVAFDGTANITIEAEGTTNLSVGTVTATNVPILSSNGIDITTLPAATNLLAGIVINGTQTFGGEKTFAESIKIGTGTKVWETVPSASTIAWKDSSDTVRMSLSNTGILDVAIKDQNDASAIKFWTGTQAQYDAIGTPSADAVYFITE